MRDVGEAVVRWRETAVSMGLSSNETERMASAFEHEELNKPFQPRHEEHCIRCHPPPKFCGVNDRSNTFHSLYLSGGSML